MDPVRTSTAQLRRGIPAVIVSFTLWLAAFAALSVATASSAAESERYLLTLSDPRLDQSLSFDEDDLMAFPQQSLETATKWTEGVHTFSGPLLEDVIESAGPPAPLYRLRAANDYYIEVSYRDLVAFHPIIALRKNGAPFGVREKGPLWLMFDFDTIAELNLARVEALSVWQLKSIEVVEQ